MADLEITLGLKSKEFEDGLRKSIRTFSQATGEMQRRTGVAARDMQRRWDEQAGNQQRLWGGVARWSARGLAAAGVAIRMGIGLMQEYAGQFPSARAKVEEFNDALADLKTGIGRDLSGGSSGLAPLVRDLESAREAVANFYADVMTGTPGHGASVTASMREDERLDGNWRGMGVRRSREEQMAIDEARASGDVVGTTRLEQDAALRAYTESLNPDVESGALSTNQAGDLVARRKRMADAEVERVRIEQRKAREAAAREAETARLDEQDRVQDFQAGIREQRQAFADQEADAQSMLEIDARRRDGMEHEADLLQIQLDLRKEIRDIEANGVLSASEREAAIGRARGRASQREGLTDPAEGFKIKKQRSGEVLGDGLATNASVRAVVFGGESPLVRSGREQVRHLGSIASTLRRIEQNGGGGLA